MSNYDELLVEQPMNCSGSVSGSSPTLRHSQRKNVRSAGVSGMHNKKQLSQQSPDQNTRQWQYNFNAKSSFSALNSQIPVEEDIKVHRSSSPRQNDSSQVYTAKSSPKNSTHTTKNCTTNANTSNSIIGNFQEIRLDINPSVLTAYANNHKGLCSEIEKVGLKHDSIVELTDIADGCIRLRLNAKSSPTKLRNIMQELRAKFSPEIFTQSIVVSKLEMNLIFGTNKHYTNIVAQQNGVNISIYHPEFDRARKSTNKTSGDSGGARSDYNSYARKEKLAHTSSETDHIDSQWELILKGTKANVISYINKLSQELEDIKMNLTSYEILLKNFPKKLLKQWLRNHLINEYKCFMVIDGGSSSVESNQVAALSSKRSDSSNVFSLPPLASNKDDFLSIDFCNSETPSLSSMSSDQTTEILATLHGTKDNITQAISHLIGIISLYARKELLIPPYAFSHVTNLVKSIISSSCYLFVFANFDAKNYVITLEALEPELVEIEDSIQQLIDEHSNFVVEKKFGDSKIVIDSKLRSNLQLIEEKYNCQIFILHNTYYIYCSQPELISEALNAVEYYLHCSVDVTFMLLEVTSKAQKHILSISNDSLKRFLFGDFNYVRAQEIHSNINKITNERSRIYEVQGPLKILEKVFHKFVENTVLKSDVSVVVPEKITRSEIQVGYLEQDSSVRYFLFEKMLQTFQPFKTSTTTNIYLSNDCELIIEGKPEDVRSTMSKIVEFYDNIQNLKQKVVTILHTNLHIISQILEALPEVIIASFPTQNKALAAQDSKLINLRLFYDTHHSDEIDAQIDSIFIKFDNLNCEKFVAPTQLVSNALNLPPIHKELVELPSVSDIIYHPNSQNGISSTVLIYGHMNSEYKESFDCIKDFICNFTSNSIEVPENARIFLNQNYHLLVHGSQPVAHAASDSVPEKLSSLSASKSDKAINYLTKIDAFQMSKELSEASKACNNRAICLTRRRNCSRLNICGSREHVGTLTNLFQNTFEQYKCIHKPCTDVLLRIFQQLSTAERFEIQKKFGVALICSYNKNSSSRKQSVPDASACTEQVSSITSAADNESVLSLNPTNTAQQSSLSIYGLEKDCLKFLDYFDENFYQSQIEIPNSFFGQLLGKKGSNLNQMRKSSDCKLNLVKSDNSSFGHLIVIGNKTKVMKLINEISLSKDSCKTETIDIPPALLPFITYKSDKWSKIKLKYPMVSLSLKVNKIVINGPQDDVKMALDSFNTWISLLNTPHTAVLYIPKKIFGLIVGKKFSSITKLQQKYKCQIVSLGNKSNPSSLDGRPESEDASSIRGGKPEAESMSPIASSMPHDSGSALEDHIAMKIFAGDEKSLNGVLGKLQSEIRHSMSEKSKQLDEASFAPDDPVTSADQK